MESVTKVERKQKQKKNVGKHEKQIRQGRLFFNSFGKSGNKLVPKGCYVDVNPTNNNYNWNNHATGAGYKGSIPVCKKSGSNSGNINRQGFNYFH